MSTSYCTHSKWWLVTILGVFLSGCGAAAASEEDDDRGEGGGEGGDPDGDPDGGAESPEAACVRLADAVCDYLADCMGSDEEACLAESVEACAGAVDAARDAVDRCIEDLRGADCDDPASRTCDDELITFEDECDGICLSGCASNEFRCARTEQCLPIEALCDGVADCPQGADESLCEGQCATDELACADGTCIPIAWKCDGNYDCSGEDDEDTCEDRS